MVGWKSPASNTFKNSRLAQAPPACIIIGNRLTLTCPSRSVLMLKSRQHRPPLLQNDLTQQSWKIDVRKRCGPREPSQRTVARSDLRNSVRTLVVRMRPPATTRERRIASQTIVVAGETLNWFWLPHRGTGSLSGPRSWDGAGRLREHDVEGDAHGAEGQVG